MSEDRADVAVRLPADGAYVTVLRSTAATLAARLDFTLDDIEDLKMAVGEACALILPSADEGGDLWCEFHLEATDLRVEVSVTAATPVNPDTDSFAWQVLTTLADDVASQAHEGRLAVSLRVRSQVQEFVSPGSD